VIGKLIEVAIAIAIGIGIDRLWWFGWGSVGREGPIVAESLEI